MKTKTIIAKHVVIGPRTHAALKELAKLYHRTWRPDGRPVSLGEAASMAILSEHERLAKGPK